MTSLKQAREYALSEASILLYFQTLIGAVDEELLSAHVTALLDKGLPSLLEAPPRIRELRLLYGLVGRVGGLGHLKAGLGSYVRRAGTALMVNQDRDKDMVQVRRVESKKCRARSVVTVYVTGPAAIQIEPG